MPQKRHKPDEIIGKLREVEIQMSQGISAAVAAARRACSKKPATTAANLGYDRTQQFCPAPISCDTPKSSSSDRHP